MPEYVSWIFSAVSIIVCICVLRNRASVTRGGRAPAARPRSNANARSNNITSTEPVVYFASEDYGLPNREYRFEYRKVQGTWRAYILKMPPLNGRSGASSITHRLTDSGRYFVCWDRPIRTLEDAQNVSRVWADNLQRYIATGQRF